MEFAGFSNEESDKKDSKKPIPLPRLEQAPPVIEGEIELRPRPLHLPLSERLVKTEHQDADHEATPAKKFAPASSAETVQAAEAEAFAPRPPLPPELQGSPSFETPRLAPETDEEDESDVVSPRSHARPRPARPQPAPGVPGAPAEQAPRAELAEITEEMNRGVAEAAGSEVTAESAISQAETLLQHDPNTAPSTYMRDPARQPDFAPHAGPRPMPAAGAGGLPPRRPPEGPFGMPPEIPEEKPPTPLATAAEQWFQPQAPWTAEQRQLHAMQAPAPGPTRVGTGYEAIGAEEQRRAEYTAEKRGLRRGLIAGFITGYVLKQFLANRKLRRFEETAERQTKQQNERFDQLTAQQRATEERLRLSQEQLDRFARQQPVQRFEQGAAAPTTPPQFEAAPSSGPLAAPAAERLDARRPAMAEQRPAEVLPPKEAAPPTPEQAAQAVQQAYDLRPQQHLEHSAWHNIVVDERGREVQGAIQYGEAFQRERQKEQVRESAFADAQQAGGQGTAMGGGIYPANPQNPMLGSGQVGYPYDLPAGQQPVDVQHRLPEAEHSMAATLRSPWLWGAIVVLILAFFAAALL